MPWKRVNTGGGLLPLVDVVFLLLIFFMLTFSLSNEKVINIAAIGDTNGGERLADRISLAADGGITLNGDAITLAAISAARFESRRIYIEAEELVPLERLVAVMEKATLSGSEVLGITVE